MGQDGRRCVGMADKRKYVDRAPATRSNGWRSLVWLLRWARASKRKTPTLMKQTMTRRAWCCPVRSGTEPLPTGARKNRRPTAADVVVDETVLPRDDQTLTAAPPVHERVRAPEAASAEARARQQPEQHVQPAQAPLTTPGQVRRATPVSTVPPPAQLGGRHGTELLGPLLSLGYARDRPVRVLRVRGLDASVQGL